MSERQGSAIGSDIHLFVETKPDPQGPWVLTAVRSKCTWCGGSGRNQRGEGCSSYGCGGTGLEAGYGSRNYALFAMLAGVRNGYDIRLVAEPRGLPADMSPELCRLADEAAQEQMTSVERDTQYERLRATYGAGWLGDHSYSWLTLAELLGYDWEQTAQYDGVITLYALKAWRAAGTNGPSSWCGSAGGGGIRYVGLSAAEALAACCEFSAPISEYGDGVLVTCAPGADCRRLWAEDGQLPGELDLYASQARERGAVSPEELAQLRAAVEAEQRLNTKSSRGVVSHVTPMTEVTWLEPYREAAGSFYKDFIPALQALGLPPDRVRIVFGFDS